MHTVWKGSIQFGLVHIPIKLHTAVENKDIKLRQLHKKCHTPISYQKTCSHCEETVEKDDIIKAYEYAKDQFVVLEEEELKQLKKDNEDKAVQILDFVQLAEIDPIYFDRSYFLAPGEGGAKAYALLQKALSDSDKIGVAKIIIRSKEHLAIVRTYKQALMMETIYFPDEVRNVQDVPSLPEEPNVDEKELKTALLLVDQLTTEFDADKYTDEYRKDLLELIENKKNGEETVTTSPKTDEPAANNTDLMSALEASLERTKPKRKKAAAKKKRGSTAKKNA
ncbi:Ku protein [Shouchella shacheensis]|uniref:non-homologous end joining protein Ku n=1 Tax=Shouchella shacheensis TaxID=1649580 RepID=UPI00073FB29D|nr:Ku protein [Shouchella shacheensis]